MKAKFGAIVVAGSGKIGGHVASRNRFGSYFRTKVTPVNPQTESQSIVRNRFSAISGAWRSLESSARTSWNSVVSDFSKSDVFGDLRNPSGFNLYQRLNNNLITVSLPPIDIPPAVAVVDETAIISLTATAAIQLFSLLLSGDVPSTSRMKVFATPNLSPGVSFVDSEYRLISVQPEDSVTPQDLTSLYTNKFGPLVAGQKVFVRVVFIDIVTGLSTVLQSTSTIVAA